MRTALAIINLAVNALIVTAVITLLAYAINPEHWRK